MIYNIRLLINQSVCWVRSPGFSRRVLETAPQERRPAKAGTPNLAGIAVAFSAWFVFLLIAPSAFAAGPEHWPQFRGGCGGVADGAKLPAV